MNEEFDETLREKIIEEGEEIYCLCWDSGGPGAGADCERIYLFKGQYYPILSYEYETQAYASLEEALEDKELSRLIEGTVEITFPPELSEKVLPLLRNIGEEVVEFKINGEAWLAMPGGELRKHNK
jgi:hypothetical protein